MGELGDRFMKLREETIRADTEPSVEPANLTPREVSSTPMLTFPELRGRMDVKIPRDVARAEVRFNGNPVADVVALEITYHWITRPSGPTYVGMLTICRERDGEAREDRFPLLPDVSVFGGQLTGQYVHYAQPGVTEDGSVQHGISDSHRDGWGTATDGQHTKALGEDSADRTGATSEREPDDWDEIPEV